MKKLRDRLNKKGFTLVELIVVIVIILILAAALVPNVMRYIKQARVSAFQAEAAAYLVELQGYEAECYAKNNADLNDVNPSAAVSGNTYWQSESSYVLSGNIGDPTFIEATAFTSGTPLTTAAGSAKAVNVYVEEGVVEAFGYANGHNFVSWEQSKGWTDIDSTTF